MQVNDWDDVVRDVVESDVDPDEWRAVGGLWGRPAVPVRPVPRIASGSRMKGGAFVCR